MPLGESYIGTPLQSCRHTPMQTLCHISSNLKGSSRHC
jgi:hypothetical protein